jgi:hypothetical protein
MSCQSVFESIKAEVFSRPRRLRYCPGFVLLESVLNLLAYLLQVRKRLRIEGGVDQIEYPADCTLYRSCHPDIMPLL